MMKKIPVLLFFGLILVFSCSKKSDPAPASPDQLLVTPKGWITTAGTINPPISIPGAPAGTPPISDFYSLFLEACEKDDVLLFTSNGQYKIDEGATKCNTSDPQTKEQGTWAFNSTKTILNITPQSGTGDAYTMTIAELSATTLKISEPFDLGNGTTYTVSLTLTAVK